MSRNHSALLIAAMALLLAGCSSGSDRGAGVSSPTGFATPGSSSTPVPGPSGGPVTMPSCSTVLTPDQVATLIDPGAEGLGDSSTPAGGGRGTTVLELLQIMDTDPAALHCTWVLPGSDAGATVSIITDTEATVAGETYLSTLTLEETTGATGERILTIRSMDGFAYTESHGFLDGVWVGVWDGFTTESSAIVDAIFAKLAAENPDRFP